MAGLVAELLLSVPKFTANLFCIRLSIDLQFTYTDAVEICGKFWDTQKQESCRAMFAHGGTDIVLGRAVSFL